MSDRVAITGLGIVSPLGVSAQEHFAAALRGQSGIRAVTLFDVTGLRSHIAGQVGIADLGSMLPHLSAMQMDRFSQLAAMAAREALTDASLDTTDGSIERSRMGVCIGTAQGGRISDEQLMARYFDGRRPRPLAVPLVMPNAALAWVSIMAGAEGPGLPIASACAAGLQSIAMGARLIESGAADIVLAGASDAPVTRTMMMAWSGARATSVRNHDPEAASRPFDAERDGFVLAEGAAVLVLERGSRAEARGVRIYAQILGQGHTLDAHDIVSPAPDGRGGIASMRAALKDAQLEAREIAWLSAHGTSTKLNDAAERRAIQTVFGSHVTELKVTALKALTGHAMGASGAIEAATAALTIQTGQLAPNRNLTRPDPECDLRHVATPGETVSGPAMINSFAFGGANVSVVLGPWTH